MQEASTRHVPIIVNDFDMDEVTPQDVLIEVEPFRWTVRNVILATLMAIGIGVGFLLLYQFYMVIFLFFVAFSLATALKPLVVRLRDWKIPPALAVLLIYLLLLLLISGFLWLLASDMTEQLSTIIQQIPDYYQTARLYLLHSSSTLLRATGSWLPLQLTLQAPALPQGADTSTATDPITLFEQTIGNVGFVVFLIIALGLLTYYWLIEGEMVLRRFLLRVDPTKRDATRTLIGEIEEKIGDYFRGQAILCGVIGVLSTIAYLLIGVPNAFVLGLIAGVFEAVPILGPTLGAIPALLITLTTAPEKTLWVIGAVVLIQVSENNLLVPRIMKESVGVNAVVTILAIAAFGLLFGFVGAILAIPLAAILQILLNRLIFDKANWEQEETATLAAPPLARNRSGILRLEAQELAEDARKQVRNEVEPQSNNPHLEQAEDMIETIARDLARYLGQTEPAQ
ncbi:MAG: AI-2E family transporter [Caldilineaceae bacterium]